MTLRKKTRGANHEDARKWFNRHNDAMIKMRWVAEIAVQPMENGKGRGLTTYPDGTAEEFWQE